MWNGQARFLLPLQFGGEIQQRLKQRGPPPHLAHGGLVDLLGTLASDTELGTDFREGHPAHWNLIFRERQRGQRHDMK